MVSGGKGGRVVKEELVVAMRGDGCGWFHGIFEYGMVRVDGWDRNM